MRGGHWIDRHDAIADVIAEHLPSALREPESLLAHVIPQSIIGQARRGIIPDIAGRTRLGQPEGIRAGAALLRVLYDVKQITGGS